MYKKISDYGVIGNFHSLALIGLDGSIDWLCLPHLYSPSIFGALLDSEKGGYFSVTPEGEYDSTAEYLENTNILSTCFRTRQGEATLTDFMTVPFGPEEERKKERHELYRRIEVVKGGMEFRVRFEPRLDYGRAAAKISGIDCTVKAVAGRDSIHLEATRPLEILGDRAEGAWVVREGETAWLHMRYGIGIEGGFDAAKAERALDQSARYWRIWAKKSETGVRVDLGPYKEMIMRSALILKLLYFYPKGTMAAAATTSLPEVVRGVRNWDYRHAWLRDTFFTLEALFNIGHGEEAHGYFGWIEELVMKYGPAIQSVYGLNGEKDLPECELGHLDGYKGSRPVRIGNNAALQRQNDIYGDILNAVHKHAELTGELNPRLWPSLRSICDFAAESWRDKDYGIWEMKSGPHHFTYSKVMCWTALERGIRLAESYGLNGDTRGWKDEAGEIRRDIMENGWDEGRLAFVQHYETDRMDASSLLIPMVGFLPFDDPRVISTVEATKRELSFNDCFFYRYKTDDGLPGEEGAFLICSFWYIDYLIARWRLEEAETYLRRTETVSNHLGLFSEEYDFKWMEPLGNFPQAYTHLGYINSVLALRKARAALKRAGPVV
ncbi:MAG: glycoside hydrolase family 15 protein [Thermodesulfobacteriota bacterium]|nr:MAG: glycoside hydrolase family 15 protein [Thermodesulfobacteriota bacterium]